MKKHKKLKIILLPVLALFLVLAGVVLAVIFFGLSEAIKLLQQLVDRD